MNRVGAQQILNGLILVKHQQVGSLILGFSGTPPVPTLNAKTSLTVLSSAFQGFRSQHTPQGARGLQIL